MKILLTGASGFLGRWLSRTLLSRGHEVFGVTRDRNRASAQWHESIVWLEPGDLSGKYLRKLQIDVVVHVATNYARQGEALSDILQANVVFPLQLVEYAIEAEVPLWVNTDSPLPRESGGYAMTKAHFLELARLVSKGRVFRLINIRFDHLIGPGDNTTKFPLRILRACLSDQESFALSHGRQKRSFIDVRDVAEAYRLVIEQPDRMEQDELDLASDEAITIRHFVETIKQMTHSTIRLDFGEIDTTGNDSLFEIGEKPCPQALGWKPRYRWTESLEAMLSEEKGKK